MLREKLTYSFSFFQWSERQSHFLSERVGVGVCRGRLRCAIAIQENGKGGPFCVEWYGGIESSVEMGNQNHAEPVCLVLSFFSLRQSEAETATLDHWRDPGWGFC